MRVCSSNQNRIQCSVHVRGVPSLQEGDSQVLMQLQELQTAECTAYSAKQSARRKQQKPSHHSYIHCSRSCRATFCLHISNCMKSAPSWAPKACSCRICQHSLARHGPATQMLLTVQDPLSIKRLTAVCHLWGSSWVPTPSHLHSGIPQNGR